MTDEADEATIIVRYFADAHDGPGWYWYYEEYPYEGLCGAFALEAECVKHAEEGDGHKVEVQ